MVIRGVPGDKSLKVFNRWGVEVYSSGKYDNSWSPEDLDDGIYYYTLSQPNDGLEMKGWFLVSK